MSPDAGSAVRPGPPPVADASVRDSRPTFAAEVAAALGAVGVEYGAERGQAFGVIVRRADAPLVDFVVASGRVGRLVHRRAEALAGRRLYVVAAGDSPRLYRRLSVGWEEPDGLLGRTGELVRRVLRRSGLSVVVAGMDRSAQSSVAAALPGPLERAFRSSMHVSLPADPLHGRGVSFWLAAMLAWVRKVALPRRRGSLVTVVDGWTNVEATPAEGPVTARLGRSLAALLLRPDLTLALTPATGAVRPLDVLDGTLRDWSAITTADDARRVAVDSESAPEEMQHAAVRALEDCLATRAGDLRPVQLAVEALGGARRGGRPHAVVSARGRARWVLPAGIGRAGPMGAGLYRPFRLRQAAGAIALELVHRSGAARLRRTVPIDSRAGLAGDLAERLGVRDVRLAAEATGDDERGRRAVLSVGAGGRRVAFAKVAFEAADRLRHERRVLEALGGAELRVLLTPAVLDCFEWKGAVVLVLEPLALPAAGDRPLGEIELAALLELGALRGALAGVLGASESAPIHGDFTPWNSALLPGGRLAVWDWEESRLGSPLEDVFHWRIQRYLRGREASLREIVEDATTPGAETAAAAARLGVPPASAAAALREYVTRTLGAAPRANRPGVRAVREATLALLAEAGR